jgi:hypothetical protein
MKLEIDFEKLEGASEKELWEVERLLLRYLAHVRELMGKTEAEPEAETVKLPAPVLPKMRRPKRGWLSGLLKPEQHSVSHFETTLRANLEQSINGRQ